LKPTGWSKIPAAHTYLKEEMNLDLSVREMATAGLSIALMSERKHYEIEAVSQRLNGIFYDLPNEMALQELRDRLDTTFYGTLKNQRGGVSFRSLRVEIDVRCSFGGSC
jgi:hypothetical protein